MYNINRRKFLGLFGCGCCSVLLPSCTTVPITERRQLSIIPEAKINMQAAAAYENFRKKTKLITKGSQLEEVRSIGKKMENAVSAFFLNSSFFFINKVDINITFLIFVFLVSSISQLGDIFISYFKRLSKTKDTGNIIPGHGGLLDRFDGMIFAFPFSYIVLSTNLFIIF